MPFDAASLFTTANVQAALVALALAVALLLPASHLQRLKWVAGEGSLRALSVSGAS